MGYSLCFRSSRPEVFCKIAVLRNFAKFTGKHLCQGLFVNKVAGQACSFINKETLVQVFPVNFAKFLRTPFFIEHLWWLLLMFTVHQHAVKFKNEDFVLMVPA